MPRTPTFVIRNADGQFYTICDIVGSTDVIETDAHGNKSVAQRHILRPRFDSADPLNCSKFGSEQDAHDMMVHAQLEDSEAFNGCEVLNNDDL